MSWCADQGRHYGRTREALAADRTTSMGHRLRIRLCAGALRLAARRAGAPRGRLREVRGSLTDHEVRVGRLHRLEECLAGLAPVVLVGDGDDLPEAVLLRGLPAEGAGVLTDAALEALGLEVRQVGSVELRGDAALAESGVDSEPHEVGPLPLLH